MLKEIQICPNSSASTATTVEVASSERLRKLGNSLTGIIEGIWFTCEARLKIIYFDALMERNGEKTSLVPPRSWPETSDSSLGKSRIIGKSRLPVDTADGARFPRENIDCEPPSVAHGGRWRV